MKESNLRKARAERVRYLREEVLELSRAKMVKRFEGLAEGTLQTWEYGPHPVAPRSQNRRRVRLKDTSAPIAAFASPFAGVW